MGRVVTDEDHRRCRKLQRAFHHLTRIDRRVVDRAAPLHLIGDQHIAFVEKEDAKLFAGFVRHGGMAILDDRRPRGQDLFAPELALQGPMGHSRDQLQVERHGLADALHLRQQRCWRTEDAGKRAESLDQRLGDWLGITPRDQPEKQELEDFVVGKRGVAQFAEAVTQPLAMTMIMFLRGERGGQGGPAIRRGRLLRSSAEERAFVGCNGLLRWERQLVVGRCRNRSLRHRIVTRCATAGPGGRARPATA